MPRNRHIQIAHLTRVEGHGNLTAVIRDGRLETARFDIVEAPRLFEAFLPGHRYSEVAHMASRICGICAVSHRCAAVKAVEAAFGVTVNERIDLLRRLAFQGEVIGSHVLHLFFLVAPDLFGVPSIFHLLPESRDTVLRAMRLKDTATRIGAAVAGRHIHPVGMAAGGFTFAPGSESLVDLGRQLETAEDDLQALLPIFQRHAWPAFENESDYLSLRHPERYAFHEGELFSSREGHLNLADYRDIVREYVVAGSNAKHALHAGHPFMVGALARFNNNCDQLLAPAREAAEALGLHPPGTNPFMIPAAQLVETVHCLAESRRIVDRLLDPSTTAQPRQVSVEPRQGQGIGAVEAPRGTLFHDYDFDGQGICTRANLVIPTAQNLANLEADMRTYIPRIADASEDQMARRLESLVRAYDPCISCATHVIML